MQSTPSPAELIQGEVKDIMEIQCVNGERTSGYWYVRQGVPGPKNRGAGLGEKVILHFHGGGYVTRSTHPKGGTIGPITDGLHHFSSITRVFAGGYRISASAPFPFKNPFPAALLNPLASYYHLIHTVGSQPENIIAGGGSASPASLRLPKDIIQDEFKGFPRKVYLLVGEAEICLDSYHTLKDRLLNCVGEHGLHYNEAPDSTHDFLTMPWHEPERTNALKDIAAWLEML